MKRIIRFRYGFKKAVGSKVWHVFYRSRDKVETANLVECIELTLKLAYENARKMGDEGLTRKDAARYAGYYALVLKDVIKFKKPVSYFHGTGPIIWKTLNEPTTKKVLAEASRST